MHVMQSLVLWWYEVTMDSFSHQWAILNFGTGSVLGHAPFNISDLGEKAKCALTRFTDDIKLGEPVSMLTHKVAVQRDLGGPEKRVSRNLRKEEVLHLGKKQ